MQIPEWMILAIVAAIGGFIRHIWSQQGKVALPRWDPATGFLDLGFLYNVFCAMPLGMLVPYGLGAVFRLVLPGFPYAPNPVAAILAGYASTHFWEKVAEYMLRKLSNAGTAPAKEGRSGIPFRRGP